MSISISGVVKQLGSAFKKLSKGTKILIFSFLGVIIAFAIIITAIMNTGKYSILYRGLSLSESSEILALLQDMAVDVKVEGDGSILVPTDKVAMLKMQLASEGYPNSTLGYDLFLDKSDLLTTDYEQKKLYIFQLQDRLQESIVTLQGVKNAIVTLGIPDNNSYVLKGDKDEVTASVVLQLFSNAKLTNKQINGIVSLVSRSVPGLSPENVVVIGDGGEVLNSNVGNTTVDSDTRIETINQINKLFEEKIKDFLQPVFGKNGMSVAVSIAVDFSQKKSEEVVYTPVVGDSGIISWVERSSENGGTGIGQDGVPIYAEGNIGGSNTNSSESYSANYLVNQLIRQIEDGGGSITDMSVAVIINSKDLSNEDIQKYRELVAFSAGISVDKVVLTNAEFKTDSNGVPVINDDEDTQHLLTLKIGKEEIIIISGAGLALIILIILLSLLSRRRLKKKLKRSFEKEKEVLSTIATNEKAKDKVTEMPGEIVLNETREQALKRQIKEFCGQNAETVAQLLRVWIKEEDNK
jgi:flagellar M-ring protein FliF